ncbi:N-acetylmuramoyl-L-alanine amidase [Streptomyces sp. NBC_00433]
MATPMSADQFLAALKAEGVTVAEHPGWRTHNRAGHGPWGPVNGVVIHHTGGQAPSDAGVVWGGRADLPGPLAHSYLAKSGVVTMTGNGRTNHAGGGDPAVLAAVVGDSYGSRPPATGFHEGSPGATDGNAHFYGLEISNWGDGKDPYPAAQHQAAVRWAAALCRHHGWSEKSVIAHAEWSDQKKDPSFDIVHFRAEVKAQLALHPGQTPAAKAGAPKAHKAAQPAHQPFPGAEWFTTGRKSPVVAAMHKRLVAVGCDRYQSGAHPDVVGSGDIASYEAWQAKYSKAHHKAWTGAALKWPPGKESWDALHVPKTV